VFHFITLVNPDREIEEYEEVEAKDEVKVEVKSKLFEIIKGRRNGNGKKFMNL
jgi:hypothetical protein